MTAKGEAPPAAVSPQSGQDLPVELAGATNAVIDTDDLHGAQREVEKVLVSNEISPLTVEQPPSSNVAQVRQQHMARASNFSQLVEAPPNQVQYLAYVTPEQKTDVLRALAGLQRRQAVPQLASIVIGEQSGPASSPSGRSGEQLFGVAAGDEAVQTGQRVLTEGIPTAEPTQQAAKPYVAIEEGPRGRLRVKQSAERAQPSGEPVQQPAEQQVADAGQKPDGSVNGTILIGGLALRGQQPQLAGANVEPLLITLNYRESSRAAQAELQTKPTTQGGGSN